MALTYQAGRRIQGTNADRVGSDAISGGWKEIGRTTLGSATDKIDVESLTNKRYYMVLFDHQGQANTNATIRVRYNNTTNSDFEYAGRWSTNGASDSTYVNELSNFIGQHSEDTSPKFRVSYIANLSNKEKLIRGHMVEQNTAGAGTAPNRAEDAEKWDNATDAISSIEYDVGAPTNSFNSGSEVVVLGYDPDDTHTDNFWEQLADITLGSDASEISSGTITAKKYLWVQVYFQSASNSNDVLVRFNNDTGSNYAHRHAINYGSDTTQTSGTSIKLLDRNGAADVGRFANFFIINNSTTEKLLIAHGTEEETSGAGNPPTSNECVGKWDNESSQITEIDCFTESGNLRSGARLRVWGSN